MVLLVLEIWMGSFAVAPGHCILCSLRVIVAELTSSRILETGSNPTDSWVSKAVPVECCGDLVRHLQMFR